MTYNLVSERNIPHALFNLTGNIRNALVGVFIDLQKAFEFCLTNFSIMELEEQLINSLNHI